MRINPEQTGSKSEWLNGALAGALFMFFLFLIPRFVSWLERNLIVPNPIQAFIEWGTTERVITYTVFDVLWDLIPFILLFIMFWVVIAYMMSYNRGVKG